MTDYANDDVYEGEFSTDAKHGHGKLHICKSGDTYEGQWKLGVRHGHGKFNWKDGDWIEGTWANGDKDGEITYHRADGSVESLMFRGGVEQPRLHTLADKAMNCISGGRSNKAVESNKQSGFSKQRSTDMSTLLFSPVIDQ